MCYNVSAYSGKGLLSAGIRQLEFWYLFDTFSLETHENEIETNGEKTQKQTILQWQAMRDKDEILEME